MAYNKTDRADAPMKRRNIRRRKKVCEYCANKEAVIDLECLERAWKLFLVVRIIS